MTRSQMRHRILLDQVTDEQYETWVLASQAKGQLLREFMRRALDREAARILAEKDDV